MTIISSIEQLRTLYDQPSERAVKKDIGHIDKHCRHFIQLSPFVVIASFDSNNQADASPRGGKPGFVKALDKNTLIVPDWGGNNRLDTLTNILSNNSIGLMFLIPGVAEVLRVNGAVELRTDTEYLSLCIEKDRLPKLILKVCVKEAYLHCAKAMLRSCLWDPKSKIDRKTLPTAGEILKDQLQSNDPPETPEAMYERYNKILY
jgi:PPOX class probable FMN-dependent enzyme